MASPTPQIITTSAKPPSPSTHSQKPWSHHLTLDLCLRVLHRTILNPGIAWILVLCLRAQVTPVTDPAFVLAIGYALLLTLLFVLRIVNQRVAYGLPRAVDVARDEVVVITGGASGLGLLIAQMYGMRGASVAVLDVADLGSSEEEEEVLGEGVGYYRCDVGDRGQLEDVKRRIVEELGPPTILVNCAAARINGHPLLVLPAEEFEKTIRTNLLAAFHLYQIFVPGMISAENGGTVVTVSSVLGQLSPAGLSDYSASKAGLSALHRTIQAELQRYEQIKTLLVEIGQMSTPLFDWVRTPNDFFAPVLETVEVARDVVAAIDSGRGGVIRLPAFAALVNWYAVLPVAVQRFARHLSGIDSAVSHGRRNSQLRGRKLPQPSGRMPKGNRRTS
ncbi:Short-chain dehydrogenase/reductase SDR [Penicillium alfredii]|uniref:Short-chain dehydrogenase/reductase SDR n=1 Tax=Penicillium alfredii TaxID=1506179 RepID=A0A9W9EMC5_9EURO|nr:Short-chain dehydrogenase/reductase SDR [Penicillium alfredii]KAJ5084426.1 Short-chain dehydrogenase/reductase SDR [Penicillium alfredii]